MNPHATLSGAQVRTLTLNDLRAFLHDFFAFGEDELDMTRIGHVRVYLGYLGEGISFLSFSWLRCERDR